MTDLVATELATAADPDVVSSITWSSERRRWEPASAAPRPQATELGRGRSVVICTYQRAVSLLRCLGSLRGQLRSSDELVIIDASVEDRSEQAIRGAEIASSISAPFRYFRVTGRYRGLTRQRNFALDRVSCDLVAFFDDDNVLDPTCLAEMEAVYCRLGEEVVGVGAMVSDQPSEPDIIWRLRRGLGAIPSLKPGSYSRSGWAVPWGFIERREGFADGDWLPGCSMWRTNSAREVRFHEGFAGYAKGEDVDFSLRMRRRGRLVMALGAHAAHLHDWRGRPNVFRIGYMGIYNTYEIQRRCLPERSSLDVVWFAYARVIESLLFCRHFFFPLRWLKTLQGLAGRFAAAGSILLRRRSDEGSGSTP